MSLDGQEFVILENTDPVIVDLDCGEGENPDAGMDICMMTHKENNAFGEDTEKPTSYVLSLGALSDMLVTSDTTGKVNEKVDPAEFYNPGADDGDGSYYILVSDQSDPTKALTDNFFAGTVAEGDSFEAAGSFGSETFVHIYASDGGALLQTINFHTSCSSPLIIGDQYGSITLEGATLEGKDSGTFYSVGGTGAPGDEGVVYSIDTTYRDGALFEVNAAGEVSFIEAPDYENPQDIGGDNKYEVKVLCETKDGVEEKIFEVCVEDQDCIKILENTDPGVIADLDCEDKEPENPDDGAYLCLLTDKDTNDFGEDTEKPSSYFLTLGELSTELVTSDTTGKVMDKVEVGAIGGTDDGDATYFVVVSDQSDATKALTDNFFSGDVMQGETFEAAGSFGSETFVHIFASDGGSLLQTINYHTSCSSPLIVGDQYGSVTLDGGTLVGKDTKTVYTIGGSSIPRAVVYEITGGDGFDPVAMTSPFFDVDPQTGEVTLAFTPDFENPLDDNGDNNYFVEVTGYFINADGSREVCEVRPIEICIEDQEEPGSLSGRYFCDTNDNDLDDGQSIDPGVEDVLVTLIDAAGNELATVKTGPEGQYSFTGLQPGTYGVKFTDPDNVLAGKQLVNPNVGTDDSIDSDAIGDTTESVIEGIVVKQNQDTPDNDAGAEYTASLGDFVWKDLDRDGVQDAGEPGVAGVTVTLTGGGADKVIGTADDTTATTTTDANGGYLFEGLDPGTEYKVTFSGLPAGTGFTVQDAGGDDAADSDADPTNGMTEIITLDPGEFNNTLDAGIVDLLGSISGRYFEDNGPDPAKDCDGLDNDFVGNTKETAVANQRVVLIKAGVGVIASTLTDENGEYEFTGLEAGSYRVRFIAVDGFEFTEANVGSDDTIDSDVTVIGTGGNGNTDFFDLAAGEDKTDVDAGICPLGALGDKVWFDADRDGIQDPNEPGVAGVTVDLLGAGEDGIFGTGDDITATTVTDANGEYLFADLKAGDYKVTFSDLPDGTEFTVQDAGSNDALDSDADPVSGMTDVVTLGVGEVNLNVDAGIVEELRASLGDFVFEDLNANGIQDGGETGIAGATVLLLNSDGFQIASTTTDPTGFYQFVNLVPGDYVVEFVQPTGFSEASPDNVGGDDSIDSDGVLASNGNYQTGLITLDPGENDPTNDMGFYNLAGLGDFVWFDEDGDGTQGANEPGVDGVTVQLKDANGNVIASTTTSNGGAYSFTGLMPGIYSVAFIAPQGYGFTLPNVGDDDEDSDANPISGMTQQVTLVSGQFDGTLDAGLVKLNNPPEPQPDFGAVCSDEAVTIDVLANDSDPDGDALKIVKVDGQAISEGTSVTLSESGAVVKLVGGELVYDLTGMDDDYDNLSFGSVDFDNFTYTVEDTAGAVATSFVDVKVCGSANSLLTDGIPATISFNIFDKVPGDFAEAYTVELSSSDGRFDGLVVDEVYCVDAFLPTVANAPISGNFLLATESNADALGLKETVGDNINLINYILNQDYTSQDNGDGTGTNFTDLEIQGALWDIIHGDDFLFGPGGNPGDGPAGTQENVDDILQDAFANGTDYQMGDGSVVAAFLVPEDGSQPYIVAFECDCDTFIL